MLEESFLPGGGHLTMYFPLQPSRVGARSRRLAAVSVAAAALLTGSLGAALPATTSTQSPITDRLAAPVLLARPTGAKVEFGRNMSWGTGEAVESPACHLTRPLCVHWTDSGDHAVPDADSDSDGIPDQVEQTLSAVSTSWATIVGKLGFRTPLPDGRSPANGGDNRFDVYLADTGSAGLAGYTSSDDPHLAKGSRYAYRDMSSFIVLDNDFRAGQFPAATPGDHLKVSAAHELFHAVQFAYDYREDTWMSEGTAAWVEDEVFTAVNLNRSYLQHSALSAPATPLDFGRQGHQYGSWLFFRYLSERFGKDFVATIWRLADDSPKQISRNDDDTYSMRAIRRAIARQGADFSKVFADFVTVNLKPSKGYREGAAYPVPYSPRLALGASSDDTGWLGTPIDHLAAAYVTYVPADSAPPGRRLQIRIDGPPRGFAPSAHVVVRFDSGRSKAVNVKLSKQGNGQVRVAFGRGKVTTVDVALINTSTRYDGCMKRSTSFACRGVPQDDDRLFKVRASVL
ncbi:MAG: DUF6055 domain-containing protein [Actinomycetia bacterium]|nr:DUF6055 domain-containing protein [Actinomycetes bacterium]